VLLADEIQRAFGFRLLPIGFHYAAERPAKSIGFRGESGCIVPFILASGKGATVALRSGECGWPCAAFHLGFQDEVFPGIEGFLSNDPPPGRECERFLRNSDTAGRYLHSMRSIERARGWAVFRPLREFTQQLQPEIVIFFAAADQISALVQLLHFDFPVETNRVLTRFGSACASLVTQPLALARSGENAAIWGCHDIAARRRLPDDLMSLSMPFTLVQELGRDAGESLLSTRNWAALSQRNLKGVSDHE
jgi:hypothetical protein